MSSYRKLRSYLDIKPFPDDFFSTLNLSNIKKGPKVSNVIYRQVKKNSKSFSRVCKRERSLDVDESYMLETPNISFKSEKIKFPNIHKPSTDADLKIVQNNDHSNDLNYQIDYETRRQLNNRRLNRYMCSEDRFRKTKNIIFEKE